jgi:hypothetical protein
MTGWYNQNFLLRNISIYLGTEQSKVNNKDENCQQLSTLGMGLFIYDVQLYSAKQRNIIEWVASFKSSLLLKNYLQRTQTLQLK